jgi:serine/threonine protein phosphatase PrpC
MALNVKIGDTIWCINVGDSRSALVTSEGKGVVLSQDASLDKEEFYQDVQDRGGKIWGRKNNLRVNGILAMATSFEGVDDQFIGVRAIPQITQIFVKKGDYLVVASDGLWDTQRTEKVLGFINQKKTSMLEQAMAQELTEFAIDDSLKKWGRTDNITVLVAKIG